MFEAIEQADTPEALALAVADQHARLESALDLVPSGASRSGLLLKRLVASATIEGRATVRPIEASCVGFFAPPFKGGLHLMYPWALVTELSRSDLAVSISRALRENLRAQGERSLQTCRGLSQDRLLQLAHPARRGTLRSARLAERAAQLMPRWESLEQ